MPAAKTQKTVKEVVDITVEVGRTIHAHITLEELLRNIRDILESGDSYFEIEDLLGWMDGSTEEILECLDETCPAFNVTVSMS